MTGNKTVSRGQRRSRPLVPNLGLQIRLDKMEGSGLCGGQQGQERGEKTTSWRAFNPSSLQPALLLRVEALIKAGGHTLGDIKSSKLLSQAQQRDKSL